jgi:hypothetical protein
MTPRYVTAPATILPTLLALIGGMWFCSQVSSDPHNGNIAVILPAIACAARGQAPIEGGDEARRT